MNRAKSETLYPLLKAFGWNLTLTFKKKKKKSSEICQKSEKSHACRVYHLSSSIAISRSTILNTDTCIPVTGFLRKYRIDSHHSRIQISGQWHVILTSCVMIYLFCWIHKDNLLSIKVTIHTWLFHGFVTCGQWHGILTCRKVAILHQLRVATEK